MTRALSIIEKQQLSKDSKTPLKWIDLDSKHKKLIQAVCFSESVEDARKNLKLSTHGFYSRWQYLKPMIGTLLDGSVEETLNILKLASKPAAKTLIDNLEANNPSDQIKAANSILDRTVGERNDSNRPRMDITLQEFIRADTFTPIIEATVEAKQLPTEDIQTATDDDKLPEEII